MSGKPKKSKIERDYDVYNQTIESKAQEQIMKLKEKIAQLKKEAEKIGEALESESSKNQSAEQEKS